MTTSLPSWLSATWIRNYIRRSSSDGTLGDRDASVTVHYLQTSAEGHAFDLRIAKSFALPEGVASIADLDLEMMQALAGATEAFAGVTTSEVTGDEVVLHWHAAFSFPPQLGEDDAPEAVLAAIMAGNHVTADIGRAVPTHPASRSKPVVHWFEYALDDSYEEEWLMLDSFYARGAHLAAIRPARSTEVAGNAEDAAGGLTGAGACWLAILGNTFAFVRDIDRSVLPPAARGRPLADALMDEAIPLGAKRALLDSEFSFGYFGHGGGVGGVVERSSLPWRKGVALATLLAEAAAAAPSVPWQPVRASDAEQLSQALSAITADHEEACKALREAEANGKAGVAEMLRARGAVSGSASGSASGSGGAVAL